MSIHAWLPGVPSTPTDLSPSPFLNSSTLSVMYVSEKKKIKMAWLKSVVLLLLFISIPTLMAAERREHEGEEGEEWPKEREEGGERGIFLLHHLKQVVKTEAGEMSVLKGYRGRGISSPMQIGFINMEPKSLMVPQYVDADLIMFVRRGQMKVGWIHKDEMVEKDLKTGDVYRLPAGTAFYFLNTGQGQRLQLVCSIDTKDSLVGNGIFQSFFIAGGQYPTPVFAGFDQETLITAFNVSADELSTITGRQQGGPIIYVPEGHEPEKNWKNFLQLKESMRRAEQNMVAEDDEEEQDMDEEDEVEEEEVSNWSWRKLLISVIGKKNQAKRNGKTVPDSYNLYEKNPDFKNNYGWTKALDHRDYEPLKRSGVGVYLVNLTAGSMLAPHVNPRATEYGIILRGSGTIQVVFPNGTSAMNEQVKEGDVFWVPRYFPFCQTASRGGPMEFFGFTTSARKNRPQFLAGSSSVLQSMRGPELAAAFDVSMERLDRMVKAQQESIILPAPPLLPQQKEEAGSSLLEKW